MTGINDIIKAIQGAHGPVGVNGLQGGSKGLLLARLASQMHGSVILAITHTEERALELLDDCSVFLNPSEQQRLTLFPESSVLPYSRISPEPEDWADRIRALFELTHARPLVLIASVAAAMRRLPPKSFISGGGRVIQKKESFDPKELATWLTNQGYEDVGLVEDEGSFAQRGGIFDLWPPTSDQPTRIELDEDRIVSMRAFDPATQRSRGEINEILLIPVRDFPFDPASRAKAAHRIRERSDKSSLSSHERRALIEAIHEGIAISGIETLMPLFHNSTDTLFDYLPANTVLFIDDANDAESNAAAHEKEILEIYRDTQSPERVIEPKEIVLSASEFLLHANKLRGVHLNALNIEAPLIAATHGNADLLSLLKPHSKGEDILEPLVVKIRDLIEQNWRVLLNCHTEVQAQRLIDLFKLHGLEIILHDAPFETLAEMKSFSLRLIQGRLSSGFRWEAEKLAIITDAEIFGGKTPRRAPSARPMEPFMSFSELAEGDYLVHEHHGIGRYLGLSHLSIDDNAGDFLLLEYLGGDKLYLPVYRLNLVGRYIGSSDAPPFLDKLGGTRWAQIQKKATNAIRLLAKELIDIYAARQVYPGVPILEGGAAYEEFAAAFPYDETPDQMRSIDDVMRDLGIERPMDRLICGDVGYGKTEVAMRAAFRAALTGMQVAILVPTTVLAFQHYETFLKRFEGQPIIIDMLSRFRSGTQQKKIIERIKSGSIDIVIGTHRLLQKDIAFKNLGLLIIDEEHRFGVRNKEKIKKLRTEVHVIALSATPIPRTLNLSLSGIRDISIINTPPANRQSIATYVAAFDDGIIRQAILREMARSGQIFFVHNRVETIESMRSKLSRIVPEARILVGHGQLHEHELEKVMLDFVEKRADVLLCTTIIESGLDIPNANTIIINRADMFGLAQLYQLRGRVGRSNLRAAAYLLTPPDKEITSLAKKRLTVLKRFTELGSGFQIAMHDLEFRGAGSILGSAQSGHITALGYELYTKLLDRAVRKLTGKKVEEEIDPELNLRVSAFLPESYVIDPGTRIDFYKRLASRNACEEIESLGEELIDRFGALPHEAQNLLGIMEIKILAKNLKMRQVLFDGANLSCQLDETTPIAADKILELAAKEPTRFRIAPPDRLLIHTGKLTGDSAIIAAAKNSLSELAACVSGVIARK